MPTLKLTKKELDLLRTILGFIECGDVSGGPIEAMSSRQTAANERVFQRLQQKVKAA